MLETIQLFNYKEGQWIPELRKYKRICQEKECKKPFAGTLDQKYCDDPCRDKTNNDKKRKNREVLRKKEEIRKKLENLKKKRIEEIQKRKKELSEYLIRNKLNNYDI